MKKKYTKEFAIGLSVIIALLVLFFGIDYLKGINVFHATNYYYASYTNVAGLAQSAPVTINGYKGGLVREIEYDYDHPGHIKVELSLDKQLRVPQGTKAILTTDLLGTASIELKMSTAGDYHNVGDKLIGENATGLMSSVSSDIMPGITAILPKIDSLLTAVTTIATDPALINSVQRLESIMTNLEQSSAQLSRAMNSLPAIANNASSVMTDAKTIAGNLNTVTTDLTTVSSQLKDMPLESTLNNVYAASQSLNDIMKKLNSNDSSLGMLVNDKQLYDNLNNASASLDSLLRDVKKNPKRYISIKLL